MAATPKSKSKSSKAGPRKSSSKVDQNTRPNSLVIEPALALLEYSSIAAGVLCGDAMVKRATLDVVRAGTVQPGRFLVLIGGPVAEVEEALKAGRETAPDALSDFIFLPGVHAEVVRALTGNRRTQIDDALGIVETWTVPAALHAADRGVKGALVQLLEVRLADGLDGKGLVFFTGKVADVEAAVEIGCAALSEDQVVRHIVVSQLHPEIARLIQISTRFGPQIGWNPGFTT